MPKLEEAEIIAKIKDGSISAITIDTSVFRKYGNNLDFKIFTSLAQFKGGAVEVVLSDIVVREITKQISAEADETSKQLRGAIRLYEKRWKSAFDTEKVLATSKTSTQLASEQIEAFLKSAGIKVIPASGQTDVTIDVIDRYFAGNAPFEESESKKHEFPDAFALLSMETVFSAKRKLLLCVSNDKGWHSFAENSEWLICVKELSSALSYFNFSGKSDVDLALQMFRAGKAPELAYEVDLAIQARLDDNDFVGECDAPMEYESEPTSATVQVIELDTISKTRIVASDPDRVTFTFEVTALVSFEAHFTFYAYDSFDKDYVKLAETDEETETRLPLELTVTIDRNVEPEPSPVSIEAIIPRYRVVNFGYIEPFGDEYPTHEKY